MLLEEFGSTLDPGAQHYLDRIQAGTQKMGLLVDELLSLAKLGRHAIGRQAVRLNPVVEEVVTMLEPDIQGREVQWVIDDLPLVEEDVRLRIEGKALIREAVRTEADIVMRWGKTTPRSGHLSDAPRPSPASGVQRATRAAGAL